METWRILATTLLALSGIFAVLMVTADFRERRGATGGQTAIAAAVSFTALIVLCVLVLTVLPSWLCWGLVVVVAGGVGLLMIAG